MVAGVMNEGPEVGTPPFQAFIEIVGPVIRPATNRPFGKLAEQQQIDLTEKPIRFLGLQLALCQLIVEQIRRRAKAMMIVLNEVGDGHNMTARPGKIHRQAAASLEI